MKRVERTQAQMEKKVRHLANPESTRTTLAECEICRHLSDVETSFSKYGWDEMTRSLPAEAWRLLPVEDTSSYDAERHHVRRCPICGTFYQYDQSYEYLVNGSEDEEVLTRLTPTQARRFLSDADYEGLIAWMAERLGDVDGSVRRFAAQSLVAHYLERGEWNQVLPLLESVDAEVVKGVLFFLVRQWSDAERLGQLLPLKPALQQLAHHPDGEVSGRASYLLGGLERLLEQSQ